MTRLSHQTSEMKKKKKENSGEISAVEDSDENLRSELDAPVWSVITFDKCAANGLTYADAAERLKKLEAEKISGLCIVTDETAARITARKQ